LLQWDLQHADRTIDLLTSYVSDAGRRALVESAAVRAWRTLSEVAAELPSQVIHCDVTDDNIVCTPDDGRLPYGIIDFGDLTRSWAVGELAVAISSVMRHAGGEPAAALPLIAAFHRERPLRAEEITALWPLVVLRATTLVVSGSQQAAIDAENGYATSALESEWQIFERSVSIPAEVMTCLIAHTLGSAQAPAPVSAAGCLLPDVDQASIREVDFSPTPTRCTRDAGWHEPARTGSPPLRCRRARS
jgi:Ser/Thr protein kinase RdoA (MazF antagonist)